MIAMPDSTNVNQLPVGYSAYLGYTDGEFETAPALQQMFPEADLVFLTVNGSTPAAHGARVAPGTDTEPGNLNAAQAVEWVARQLAAPSRQPGALGVVLYASVIGAPGYGMTDVLRALVVFSIDRSRVRLLSAHYGEGPHICGPGSCGLVDIEMDGTQWTNTWTVEGGALIDMSMLADDFFGPAQTETERLVTELGTVQQGMTGAAVKTVQGLILARGYSIGPAGIDGNFGQVTSGAVQEIQRVAKIGIDGIVGPKTWPVLLGVA